MYSGFALWLPPEEDKTVSDNREQLPLSEYHRLPSGWNCLWCVVSFIRPLWRVYRRAKKDEDYTNYKDGLNTATTGIGKYKISMSKH